MDWTTGLTFKSLIDRLESSSLGCVTNARIDRDLIASLLQSTNYVHCIQSRAKVVWPLEWLVAISKTYKTDWLKHCSGAELSAGSEIYICRCMLDCWKDLPKGLRYVESIGTILLCETIDGNMHNTLYLNTSKVKYGSKELYLTYAYYLYSYSHQLQVVQHRHFNSSVVPCFCTDVCS